MSLFRSEDDPSAGFEDVNATTLWHGVNRMVRWLLHELSTPYRTVACTVACTGPTDAQYLIAVLAAARAGAHLSLPSPQDAPNMQSHPLGEAKVRALPHAIKTKHAVDLICCARADGSDTNNFEVPTLLTMLDPSIAAAVLYDRV